MSSVVSGSETLMFHQKGDIADYLLQKILENKKRYIGTEWEMFFISPDGMPITRVDGLSAMMEIKAQVEQMGYKAEYILENQYSADEKIVGLNIEGLGSIVPEAGFQFEFATSVCQSSDDVFSKNETAFQVFQKVAKKLNYKLVFKGHIAGYAEKAEGIDRSRSVQWRTYYNKRFKDESLLVRDFQDGTASIQVTIDGGGEKFHEFFKTLLLVEPLLSLYYANSKRSYIGIQAYGKLIPSQVEPLIDAWNAQTPIDTVKVIVDRLMDIEAPFLPDPENHSLYRAEPFIQNKPPTVRDLMEGKRLNEKILNNVGGFFYMRPSFRHFSQGLIEMRGIDSLDSPEKVFEVAQRVSVLVYNDAVRENLLEDYGFLTTKDVCKMHHASALFDRVEALNTVISGKRIIDFIDDILDRSDSGVLSPALAHSYESRAVA